jgi:hypothetical protein
MGSGRVLTRAGGGGSAETFCLGKDGGETRLRSDLTDRALSSRTVFEARCFFLNDLPGLVDIGDRQKGRRDGWARKADSHYRGGQRDWYGAMQDWIMMCSCRWTVLMMATVVDRVEIRMEI